MMSGLFRGIVIGFTGTSVMLVATYFAVMAITPEPPVRYFGRYASFEHPADWQCWPEATDTVCMPDKETSERTAMIVGTSMSLQDSDSLESFIDHLSTPRDLVDNEGVAYTSEVLSVEQREINGQTWVIGVQAGSEMRDYETHYFASIHGTVAILYTFSLHSEVGARHRQAEQLLARSLELF